MLHIFQDDHGEGELEDEPTSGIVIWDPGSIPSLL